MPFPRDRESVKKALSLHFVWENLIYVYYAYMHKKYVRIHFFDNQITKKTMDLKKKFSCSDQFVHPLYVVVYFQKWHFHKMCGKCWKQSQQYQRFPRKSQNSTIQQASAVSPMLEINETVSLIVLLLLYTRQRSTISASISQASAVSRKCFKKTFWQKN